MSDALGDVTVEDRWSDAVGDTLRVFSADCHRGRDPAAVLVMTDANGFFGLAVDTVRSMQLVRLVPPLVIVGIGYPTAATLIDTIDVRARDLTPTHDPHFAMSGGADRFAQFLELELLPGIADQFPTARRTIYFGHSLGGSFGAHLLYTKPQLFDRLILSSPSLWWDSHRLLARADDEVVKVPVEVVLGIGSEETDPGRRREAANLPDGHPAKPAAQTLDMVADMGRFEAALRHRSPAVRVESTVVADEFHSTVAGAVLSRGLRATF